jgi:hypothetical protein
MCPPHQCSTVLVGGSAPPDRTASNKPVSSSRRVSGWFPVSLNGLGRLLGFLGTPLFLWGHGGSLSGFPVALTFFRHGILSWPVPNTWTGRRAAPSVAPKGRSRERLIGWRATGPRASRLPSGTVRFPRSWKRPAGGEGRCGRCRHLGGLESVYPGTLVAFLAVRIHYVMPRADPSVALLACRYRVVEHGIFGHFLLRMSRGSGCSMFERSWLGFHQGVHADSALILRYVPGALPAGRLCRTSHCSIRADRVMPDLYFGIRRAVPLSDGPEDWS